MERLQSIEQPPVYTLPMCFAQFAERFAGRKNFVHRKRLADFVEASFDRTVGVWLRGKSEPVGGFKWKAAAFFQLAGYSVSEFAELRPAYRDVVLIYALKVASFGEIIQAFGFETKQPGSRLYSVLNRNGDLLPERFKCVTAFVAEKAESLALAKELFVLEYADVLLSPVVTAREGELSQGDTKAGQSVAVEVIPPKTEPLPTPPPAKEDHTPALAEKQVIIESLAHMVRAMLPLAKAVASDTFTQKERAQLRELTGGDGVFNLSNLISLLCGETARNQKGVTK